MAQRQLLPAPAEHGARLSHPYRSYRRLASICDIARAIRSLQLQGDQRHAASLRTASSADLPAAMDCRSAVCISATVGGCAVSALCSSSSMFCRCACAAAMAACSAALCDPEPACKLNCWHCHAIAPEILPAIMRREVRHAQMSGPSEPTAVVIVCACAWRVAAGTAPGGGTAAAGETGAGCTSPVGSFGAGAGCGLGLLCWDTCRKGNMFRNTVECEVIPFK
jgi:hypothetical protein